MTERFQCAPIWGALALSIISRKSYVPILDCGLSRAKMVVGLLVHWSHTLRRTTKRHTF